MKQFLLLISLFVLGHNLQAQTDTLPPYQQVPYIPPFNVQLTDGSWFTKNELSTRKPTLILYFNPDCGHCQLETEEIIANITRLKHIQIIMVTSKPYEEMVNFANHFKLDKFDNIKVGTDVKRFVSTFYDVKFTPFSALYNKKGKLIKAYEQGLKLDELVSLTK